MEPHELDLDLDVVEAALESRRTSPAQVQRIAERLLWEVRHLTDLLEQEQADVTELTAKLWSVTP
jgi:hypothetical protein